MHPQSDIRPDNYTLLKEIYLWLDNGDRRMLQQYNISTARFNVLNHLSCYGPLSQSALRALLLCDKANVTRLLDGMEADRLICRKKDTADARRTVVTLTDLGMRLWEKVSVAHQQYTAKRFQCLSTEEQQMLSNSLLCLRATLQTLLLEER